MSCLHGHSGARTHDLLVVTQMLSRLSYVPVIKIIILLSYFNHNRKTQERQNHSQTNFRQPPL